MPLIIAFIAVFVAGNGSGWLIHSWKAGAQVALIQSEKQSLQERNDTLTASNGQCKTDIESVRQSVIGMRKAADDRVKAVDAEMLIAQPKAAIHTRAAITIKAAPVPSGESLCQTIEREQKEYVQARHVNN